MATARRAVLISVLPVAVLAGLACDPALDPLWPSKMQDVSRLETDLQNTLRQGMRVQEVRQLLRAKGIEFSERENEMFGASNIGAFEFPCGYEVSVDLMFDAATSLDSSRLNNITVREARKCP